MEDNLQVALETRQEKEMALADCRNVLEAATTALRGLDEQRMKIEQGLEPLRGRIGDLKLKEQAAALNTEPVSYTHLYRAGTTRLRHHRSGDDFSHH